MSPATPVAIYVRHSERTVGVRRRARYWRCVSSGYHQLTSVRQAAVDSTTPEGTLVEDAVGSPHRRVPHTADSPGFATRPQACFSAAPQLPRRPSAIFRKPYACGSARACGGLPSGHVAWSSSPCARQALHDAVTAARQPCSPPDL